MKIIFENKEHDIEFMFLRPKDTCICQIYYEDGRIDYYSFFGFINDQDLSYIITKEYVLVKHHSKDYFDSYLREGCEYINHALIKYKASRI